MSEETPTTDRWSQAYRCGCKLHFPRKKLVDRRCPEHDVPREGKPSRNSSTKRQRKAREKKSSKKKFKPIPEPMQEKLNRNRSRCREYIKAIEDQIKASGGQKPSDITWALVGAFNQLSKDLRKLSTQLNKELKGEPCKMSAIRGTTTPSQQQESVSP